MSFWIWISSFFCEISAFSHYKLRLIAFPILHCLKSCPLDSSNAIVFTVLLHINDCSPFFKWRTNHPTTDGQSHSCCRARPPQKTVIDWNNSTLRWLQRGNQPLKCKFSLYLLNDNQSFSMIDLDACWLFQHELQYRLLLNWFALFVMPY